MNKDSYRQLCEIEDTIPIFSQSWWLDAVIGSENWDVALVGNETEIKAAMPYVTKKKFGFIFLTSPKLTQTLGPWIRESTAKYAKQLAQQKDLMQQLIEQLPDFHHFSQNWHYSQTNWLPFYWNGFQQSSRYTYILPDLSNIDSIWSDVQSNIKREIRKAEGRFKLKLRTDASIDEFIDLNFKTFERQNKTPPYTRDFIKRLDKACLSNDARQIFIAEDEDGKQHAGIYLVWNKYSAYYLMGGGDPDLRNSGATSLCMWEAIKFAATKTNQFDFEGSMIEPIERFFRGFGARQTPYNTIYKNKNKLVKAAMCLRDILKN